MAIFEKEELVASDFKYQLSDGKLSLFDPSAPENRSRFRTLLYSISENFFQTKMVYCNVYKQLYRFSSLFSIEKVPVGWWYRCKNIKTGCDSRILILTTGECLEAIGAARHNHSENYADENAKYTCISEIRLKCYEGMSRSELDGLFYTLENYSDIELWEKHKINRECLQRQRRNLLKRFVLKLKYKERKIRKYPIFEKILKPLDIELNFIRLPATREQQSTALFSNTNIADISLMGQYKSPFTEAGTSIYTHQYSQTTNISQI